MCRNTLRRNSVWGRFCTAEGNKIVVVGRSTIEIVGKANTAERTVERTERTERTVECSYKTVGHTAADSYTDTDTANTAGHTAECSCRTVGHTAEGSYTAEDTDTDTAEHTGAGKDTAVGNKIVAGKGKAERIVDTIGN